MRSLARWSVANPVVVNLLMLFAIVSGLLKLSLMRREIFPSFSLDVVRVSVVCPGASPEEVEESVCMKVEEACRSVEGIDYVKSSAREGVGEVNFHLEAGADVRRVLDDVKMKVEAIDTFPEEAEKPLVWEVVRREPTLNLAIYGELPVWRLREIAERIRDDLLDYPEISTVMIGGVGDYELHVEPDTEALRKYGLRLADIEAAIRRHCREIGGGEIRTSAREIGIRTGKKLYHADEFLTLPVRVGGNGSPVVLADVARVWDGFEQTPRAAYYDGRRAVILNVMKAENDDSIAISRRVHEYVVSLEGKLPWGVKVEIWNDFSRLLRQRMELLRRNGLQGMLFVFICLALFLNLRLAFWVAMGIPVSFMIALVVLQVRGDTINMLSLFSFIMALGIVVDDAIVIGENIYSHYQRGASPVEAAQLGAAEVAWPVVNSVATTVVAFLPLLYIKGVMGKFIAVIPVTVIAVLSASLLEALTLLPAHVAHSLERHARRGTPLLWLTSWTSSLLERAVERWYGPAIEWVARWRYSVLALGVAVILAMAGLFAGGHIPYVFFQKEEGDLLIAVVRNAPGTSVSVTRTALQRIERSALRLNALCRSRGLASEDVVLDVITLVGEIIPRGGMPGEVGAHCGMVMVELEDGQRRTLASSRILNLWRRATGTIPGAKEVRFEMLVGGPAGTPIEIQLEGSDYGMLRAAAAELERKISSYEGTFDVRDDFEEGNPEARIRLNALGRSLGLTPAEVGAQLRSRWFGRDDVRIQRGRNEVVVRIALDERERSLFSTLAGIMIRTPDGAEIRLDRVADISMRRGYSLIRRYDGRRVLKVSADVDEEIANASLITSELFGSFLPSLKRKWPALRWRKAGQQKYSSEAIGSLKVGFLIALMGIYLLLAWQFASYTQPFIIMAAIPFGLTGAVLSHMLAGMEVTIMSLFGMVALTGIVVNDSLILIDFINSAIRRGASLEEAVCGSGRARFRAVFLTTVTTVAGLTPLMMERSFQAKFLIPMAVSIAGGISFATLLTLFLVPALYMILHDLPGLTPALHRTCT